MRHLAAVGALALSCALLTIAGCLQSPTTTLEASGRASPSIEQTSEPGGPEPIGEAPQPMGHVPQWFGSKDFPFETWLPDDGTDVAGGMQRSVTSLSFVVMHGIKAVYQWDCPIEVDVPLRTKALGTISPSRASLWTTEAANLAAPLLMDSRDPDEWRGQGEAYCKQLYRSLESRMNAAHKGLGARVHRP